MKHRRIVSVLLLIAVIVAGTFIWKHRGMEARTGVEASREVAAANGISGSENNHEEIQESAAQRTLKVQPKTVHEESTRTETQGKFAIQQSTGGEESTHERTGNKIINAVQSAVYTEDPKVAFDAYLALQRCRDVPLSQESLNTRLDAADRAQSDPSMNLDSMIAIRDTLSSQQHIQSDCADLLSEKSGDLGRELLDQARAGNQMARFLYAMWAPNDELSLLMGNDSLIEFETTALEFTLRNLDEGSALGLLALGLSYSTGDYFTPQQISLGSALLIASNLCSGGIFSIEHQLGMNSTVLNAKSSFSAVASEALVLEQSTKLYEAHCAESISRSQSR